MSRRLLLLAISLTAVVALAAPAGARPGPQPPVPHADDPVPSGVAGAAPGSDVNALSAALSGIAKIAAGYDHSCALMTNGTAKCWGNNSDGQIGDGTFNDAATPRNVKGPSGSGVLSNIVDLDAGEHHTCAHMADGTARCWGDNSDGQIGDGSFTDRNLPRTVRAGSGTGATTGIVELFVNQFSTCAVLTSSQARCWGFDGNGILGDGNTTNRNLPRTVLNSAATGPMTNVTNIGIGNSHSCFANTGGTAQCVGSNFYGALGNGSSNDSLTAKNVKGPSGSGVQGGIVSIHAGYYHTCAFINGGTVRCWGYNLDGEVGDGTTTDRHLPRDVKAPSGTGVLSGVADVAIDGYSSCARLSSGTARCWGEGDFGEIGNGSFAPQHLPRDVKNPAGDGVLTNIAQLSAGSYSICTRQSDGTARCWGYNFFENLGIGNGSTTDQALPIVVKA
jgi:alpha-tubulin suppressor-like RCC1 family protein